MASTVPTIALNDGNAIPQLGFGVWQVESGEAAGVVVQAIEAGYTSIDTAQAYQNEAGVGEAIKQANVDRKELFITSKLKNDSHERDKALPAFDATMKALGIDQLDLLLIHWPVPKRNKYVEAWKTLVELQQQGRIKSIGVSNFNVDHLQAIIDATGVVPVVNQIELHPGFQQRDKLAFHKEHNIAIEAWSPLGQGQALSNDVIAGIAEKYGKSPAQAILRWHLDSGHIAIPKSVTQSRIIENIDVFDFKLDEDDMARIAALDDPNGKIGGDPMKFP